MTTQEAKKLYPGRKDYQFQPVNGIEVSDRVCWLDSKKERQEGTVIFFFRYAGAKPTPPKFELNPDWVMVRIHQDDGSRHSKEFWNISKAKTAQP